MVVAYRLTGFIILRLVSFSLHFIVFCSYQVLHIGSHVQTIKSGTIQYCTQLHTMEQLQLVNTCMQRSYSNIMASFAYLSYTKKVLEASAWTQTGGSAIIHHGKLVSSFPCSLFVVLGGPQCLSWLIRLWFT